MARLRAMMRLDFGAGTEVPAGKVFDLADEKECQRLVRINAAEIVQKGVMTKAGTKKAATAETPAATAETPAAPGAIEEEDDFDLPPIPAEE